MSWHSFTSSYESGHSRHSSGSVSSSRRSDVHQNLLITLACCELADVSINERIYPAIGAPLGTGATFSVERKEAKGRRLVAVKHIRTQGNSPDNGLSVTLAMGVVLDDVLLELRVLLHLNALQHRNVVRLLAYGWDEGPLPYLVLEYADLGSLKEFLQTHPQSWDAKNRVAIGLASALEMLHACEVIHGDIKMENILVFSNHKRGFDAKLADFGLSCSTALGRHAFCGTPLLNPPEVRARKELDGIVGYEKADIYMYGMAVWEILNDGRRFYHSPSISMEAAIDENDSARSFLHALDSRQDEITPYATEFIRDLSMSPDMRDKMSSALGLALLRDPEERCDAREFRLILDPSDENEPMIASPLLASCYSIFDLTASPLPWGSRRGLKETFDFGSKDGVTESRGQDAFNNAALLAAGFGCEIDYSMSLKELQRSSSLGYLPAIVLCCTFVAGGLMNSPPPPSDPVNIDLCRFLNSIGSELRLQPQETKFATQFRRFYHYQNVMLARAPIAISLGGDSVELNDQTKLEQILQGRSKDEIDDATVIISFEGEHQSKPLMHHLVSAHAELAGSLLDRGCDASRRTNNLLSMLILACAAGSSTLVRLLLTKCPEYAPRATREGVSPLHWLFMFEEDQIEVVAKDLVKAGADLMRVGVASFPEFNLIMTGSPLHWAIAARNVRAIEVLVSLGADVNMEVARPMVECLEYSPNPLDFAISLVMPEVVSLLIRLGARSNDKRSDGKMPLHHIGNCTDPFRLWMYHGNTIEAAVTETVQALLDSGADLDGHDDEESNPLDDIATSPSDSILALEPFLRFNPTPSENPLLRVAAFSLQHDHAGSQKMALISEYYARNLSRERFLDECRAAIRACAKDGTVAAGRVILSHLAQLALEQPPWLITQQGIRGVEQYETDLRHIVHYLVESVEFQRPAETSQSDHDIARYWTRPSPGQWREIDQLADWYNPRQYDETGRSTDSEVY